MKRMTLSNIAIMFIGVGLSVGCKKTEDQALSQPAAPGPETNSTKPEISAKTPDDWLVVEDTTYIPVSDDLSHKMLDAKRAYLKKDNKTAADDTRQAAVALSAQSSGASTEGQTRILAASKGLDQLAAELDKDKVSSVKRLDAAFVRAHDADIEQRWAPVADQTVWYPYVNEPDQHFTNAHDAYVSHDLKKAAEEIRKGEAYVRLEDTRASGEPKRTLEASGRELDRLAEDVSRGRVKEVKSLDSAFARADYALALSHRAKASESWASQDATKTGYELRAAANYLDHGASRMGSEAESSLSPSVRDTRAVAERLIQGTRLATDDVAKAIDKAGGEIDAFGKRVVSGRP